MSELSKRRCMPDRCTLMLSAAPSASSILDNPLDPCRAVKSAARRTAGGEQETPYFAIVIGSFVFSSKSAGDLHGNQKTMLRFQHASERRGYG